MFIAFTLFGSMPLLGFVLTALFAHGSAYSFQISIAITAVTLFALGTVKTSFGAGVRPRRRRHGGDGAPRHTAHSLRRAPRPTLALEHAY